MTETRPGKKRINGLFVLAAAFAVLVVLNYRPSVARVHCNEETLSRSPEVIMLGTWWCPYCYQARRYFSENNVSYCEYDIERSAEGERRYNEVNGRAVPVIIIGDYMMSGFSEQRFEQLQQHARAAAAGRDGPDL